MATLAKIVNWMTRTIPHGYRAPVIQQSQKKPRLQKPKLLW